MMTFFRTLGRIPHRWCTDKLYNNRLPVKLRFPTYRWAARNFWSLFAQIKDIRGGPEISSRTDSVVSFFNRHKTLSINPQRHVGKTYAEIKLASLKLRMAVIQYFTRALLNTFQGSTLNLNNPEVKLHSYAVIITLSSKWVLFYRTSKRLH